jgi:transglutaminase-like putative cysteine protease
MVALQGGPRNWAVAAGALCFPIIPGIWAWWANSGRSSPPRFGRIGDLGFRTAVVNLLFIGLLLGLRPQAALVAVSTRGDWFLDEVHADWAPGARTVMLSAAGGLAALHEVLVPNPYAPSAPDHADQPAHPTAGKVVVVAPKSRAKAERRPPPPTPIAARRTLPPIAPELIPAPPPPAPAPSRAEESPQGELLLSNRGGDLEWKTDAPMPKPGLSVLPEAPALPEIRRRAPAPPAKKRSQSTEDLSWPVGGGAHPGSQDLPSSSTESVAALAEYFAGQSSDPFVQVRTLHDWMASNITYDDLALKAETPPSYEPEDVLRSRKAVCAGYARLFGAVAKQLDLRSTYIVGRTRGADASLSAMGHAWNAVQIGGAWYLVDVTWDAMNYTSGRTEGYSAVHLLTPPEVMRITHLPDQEQWQLTPDTLTLGEFLRQPMTVPHFSANGLTLVSPKRPHLNVRSKVEVRIDNPDGRYLSLTLEPADEQGSRKHRPCAGPIADADARLSCSVPAGGQHNLALWVGDAAKGRRVLSARWQVVRQ